MPERRLKLDSDPENLSKVYLATIGLHVSERGLRHLTYPLKQLETFLREHEVTMLLVGGVTQEISYIVKTRTIREPTAEEVAAVAKRGGGI